MDVPGPERRLAAVLAADMVGYSRLMEVDETGTLARLKTHRLELIDPAIAKNRGRIMVGYSRLMEVDETGTLARLKTHRLELIDPAIAKNRGRIIKTTGDGMLVEFHSVADAVLCATAFARRNVEFIVNVHTRWREPTQGGTCIAWARNLFDALAPHATGNVYVNFIFISDDEGDRVRGAYGANYERLAAIKRRYDPENVFRLNQNIAA